MLFGRPRAAVSSTNTLPPSEFSIVDNHRARYDMQQVRSELDKQQEQQHKDKEYDAFVFEVHKLQALLHDMHEGNQLDRMQPVLLIVDIDETLLVRDHRHVFTSYDLLNMPVAHLLDYALQLPNVHIVFLTGQPTFMRDQTLRRLHNAGYDVGQDELDIDHPDVGSNKMVLITYDGLGVTDRDRAIYKQTWRDALSNKHFILATLDDTLLNLQNVWKILATLDDTLLNLQNVWKLEYAKHVSVDDPTIGMPILVPHAHKLHDLYALLPV